MRSLIDVALGRRKADLVVKDGQLVNVCTGEIIEHSGLAIKNDRIAFVGNVEEIQCDGSSVINAKGAYLVPGFIDGHVHVESSMLTLTQFARAVLSRGTTAVMMDPHEIANVLGLKGIHLMLREARNLPLKVFVQIPSCVPSSPGLETTGATINSSDVKKAMGWKGIVGLGEVMNFPGIFQKSWKLLKEIEEADKSGVAVEGHAPKLTETQLNAYAASRIEGNHEVMTADYALQNLRLGIKLEVREGSSMKNMDELLKVLLRTNIEDRHCFFVSDDITAMDLVDNGHMDHIVRRAIEEGLDPIRAIQMVTINPAEHFKVSKEVGMLAPSRIADVLIVRNIKEMKPHKVIANGRVVAQDGIVNASLSHPEYPVYAKKTMHVGKRLSIADFDIKSPVSEGTVKALVIEITKGGTATRKLMHTIRAKDGMLEPDSANDIVKIGVVERHRATGNIGKGFVKGFGIKKGAIVSTVGHDAHNMVVLGLQSGDMAFAANVVSDMDGGLAAVEAGHVLAKLALPVAGLMSEKPADEVARKARALNEAARRLGVKVDEPFSILSFMSLAVIPEIRITDKGLVDVDKSSIMSLLVPE